MNEEQRRNLENQLVVMGLNKLEDPELVAQMAMLINGHPGYPNGNEFMLGFINECDAPKRREMYDALKPYLRFKLWAFDTFINKLTEHASNVESVDQPVIIGEDKGCELCEANHAVTGDGRWHHYGAPEQVQCKDFRPLGMRIPDPIVIGGKKYEQVAQAEAEWCFLQMTCCKCTRIEEYSAATMVSAITLARQEGWVRDLERQKEVCPKCPAVRPN